MTARRAFVAEHRASYEKLRKAHSAPRQQVISLERRARGGRRSSGVLKTCRRRSLRAWHVLDNFSLATLRKFIDWNAVLPHLELKGVYPRILDDERQGRRRRQIFAEANALLDTIVEKKLLTARGV